MKNDIVHEGHYSRVIRIFDDLYFREGNLEVRDQCNCGFVVLDNSVAIIDYPQQDPDHEVIDEAEKLTGLPVKYIIVTHSHIDHVVGFRTLHRKDVELITRRHSIENLYLEGYPVPPIELAIESSMDVVLDGRKIHFEVPEKVAHSPWDMVVEIPEYKTIFTGDMVALQKNMFFHSSDIKGWIETVAHLKDKGYEYIIPGHGPIAEGDFLNTVGEYLRLLDRAREWQMQHNENVTPESIENADTLLSAELSVIAKELLKSADAKNIARQINQLYYKLR